MKFYIDFQCQNITKRYSENRGECIFGNEKPVSFWGPKVGPRPPAN